MKRRVRVERSRCFAADERVVTTRVRCSRVEESERVDRVPLEHAQREETCSLRRQGARARREAD